MRENRLDFLEFITSLSFDLSTSFLYFSLMALALQVAAEEAGIGFVVGTWFDSKVAPGLPDEDAKATVRSWLIDNEYVTKAALAMLTADQFPADWRSGRCAGILYHTGRIREEMEGPPVAKRARANNAQGAPNADVLVDVEGGGQKPWRQKNVTFIGGKQLPTNSTEKMAERTLGGQLIMNTVDEEKLRTFGMSPTYDHPVVADGLMSMATEVVAAIYMDTARTSTTVMQQRWWTLGEAFATMAGARVCLEPLVMGRLVRGEWSKYKLGDLSLRDFHREGPYKVGAACLVDYSFVLKVMDSLRGLVAMACAALSAALGAFAEEFCKRVTESQHTLNSAYQMRFYTSVNDAIADAWEEARSSSRTPVEVGELLVQHLGTVILTPMKDGAAANDTFARLRLAQYSWGESKLTTGPPAPVALKGGGGEGVKGVASKGVEEQVGGKVDEGQGGGGLCVDFLRGLLGLRSVQPRPNGGVAPLVECKAQSCKKTHVQLNRWTKADLVAALEKGGIDLTSGFGQGIKNALDRCGKLKKG